MNYGTKKTLAYVFSAGVLLFTLISGASDALELTRAQTALVGILNGFCGGMLALLPQVQQRTARTRSDDPPVPPK